MENRENEIRRTRLVFGIVGSLLFIFLGWYLYSAADKQTLMPSNILEIIGIVAMVFFGCAALIGLKKYLE
jgi:ABC-type antimicrobial peptide transport system permease subunit